jgi:hypothetical protein
MDHHFSPLERAFELARSGSCASMTDIRRKLRSEGYSVVQITGKTLFKQMRELISAARVFDQEQPVSSPEHKREEPL